MPKTRAPAAPSVSVVATDVSWRMKMPGLWPVAQPDLAPNTAPSASLGDLYSV